MCCKVRNQWRILEVIHYFLQYKLPKFWKSLLNLISSVQFNKELKNKNEKD